MDELNTVLQQIDDLVWGIPLIVFILLVGIILTIRLRGIQVRRLGLGIKYLLANDDKGEHGDLSSFAALCTALSATIGTGNIVGVATAIVAGGPGALFWMWVAALLGTATKFTECMLAVKYRKIADDGHVVGGPFLYIENGMGSRWKWLGKIFAVFGMLVGLLGIGTFTQVNGITGAVKDFFDPTGEFSINLFGYDYSIAIVIAGVILTLCAALSIIGGISRISKVAERLVPFMAVLYVAATLLILILNFKAIPSAFVTIFESAFGLRAVSGGALGAIMLAMQKGIARGIFSNEAGLGSAPIAAAAASTNEPVRQGLVSMLGTVIDTLIICTMTGLTIVITGAYLPELGLNGVEVTNYAFAQGLPFSDKISSFILMLCLVFFAFTTTLGWNYYSEKCLEYLSNGSKPAIKIFRILYIAAIFIGPYMTISAVWTIADILNGLMAIPNLIALIALSGVAAKEVKEYFSA